MTEFLSEEGIARHKEYVRQMRLKYSILESSIPSLKGVTVSGISRLRMRKIDREDAVFLLSEITLHELFFTSFLSGKYPKSESISRLYGSEAAFLNLLFNASKNSKYGFLTVDKDARFSVHGDACEAFACGSPILAVDLCEHAYFLDYGFDKERYLAFALSHLDLTKI